jgi:hypothetical protein
MEQEVQPVVAQEEVATEVTAPETPVKTFTQEDVDKIIQKRLASERRRLANAQRKIGELTAKGGDEPVKAELNREQFSSYEEFLEAKAAKKAEEAVDRRLKEQDESRKKQLEQESERERATTWAKRQEAGRKKYEDFDEVAGSEEVVITKDMAAVIMDSDLGHEIAYFLGKNPDEAERIAELSPSRQAAEIGKLELKLANPAKPSSAPAPINPVKPKGTVTTGLSDSLDIKEWMRRRNEQMRRK